MNENRVYVFIFCSYRKVSLIKVVFGLFFVFLYMVQNQQESHDIVKCMNIVFMVLSNKTSFFIYTLWKSWQLLLLSFLNLTVVKLSVHVSKSHDSVHIGAGGCDSGPIGAGGSNSAPKGCAIGLLGAGSCDNWPQGHRGWYSCILGTEIVTVDHKVMFVVIVVTNVIEVVTVVT